MKRFPVPPVWKALFMQVVEFRVSPVDGVGSTRSRSGAWLFCALGLSTEAQIIYSGTSLSSKLCT